MSQTLTTSKPRATAEHLVGELRSLAMTKGPDTKMPTVQEICDRYGATRVTLTKVLDELEVQRVIYRRPGNGIFVSPMLRRKKIAIVINSSLMKTNASPFWGSLLGQFATYAESRRRDADQDFDFYITSPAPPPHGSLPDHVRAAIRVGTVHGVVAISLSNEDAVWLLDQGIPCVAYAGWSRWTVTTEDVGYIHAGLEVLARQGCRRVAFWGLPRADDGNPKWYEDTCRDVETAYRALGLDLRQPIIGPAVVRPPGVERHQAFWGYEGVKALFQDPNIPKPDGLFIGDDTMASGVLIALLELGVKVGQDIKIVSHANRSCPVLFGIAQRISLLEYDPAEIAEALLNLLDRVMADPDLPDEEVHVPFHRRGT